ncbi:nucleotidyltransferase family protein [Candidatus Poribacteria bacterium]
MKKEEILEVLNGVKEEVKREYKVEIKGIFGSYARGDDREESDVDVLVDFEARADLFDLVGLGLFLEEKLHRKVDVVPEDSLREEIKPNVLKEIVYL